MEDIKRAKTFSSSQMYRLVGAGSRKMNEAELEAHKEANPKSKARTIKHIDTPDSKFYTYVEEVMFEIGLGRELNQENSARPTAWGTIVEEQCFSKMGLEYSLVSKEREFHKDYPNHWSGVPDFKTDQEIGDIKCPWTLKSFCQLVKAMDNQELFKEKYPEYYWQLVSNAILCGVDKATIVVYCPFKKDLKEIRELAEQRIGEMGNRFAFINWSEDNELPYLIEGKEYNDLNQLEINIPQEDKDDLTYRVEMAINQLK